MLNVGWKGRVFGGTLVLAVGLVCASPAAAATHRPFSERNAAKATCDRGRDMVEVKHKTCPATPRRPPILLSRACCRNRNGRVQCKPFLPCPRRSPS